MSDEKKTGEEKVVVSREALSALLEKASNDAADKAASAVMAKQEEARKAAEAEARKAEEDKAKADADEKARKEEIDERVRAALEDLRVSGKPARVPVAGSAPQAREEAEIPILAAPKPWYEKYDEDTVMFVRGLRNGPIAAQIAMAQIAMKNRAPLKTTASDSSGAEHLLPTELAAIVSKQLWKLIEFTKKAKLFPTTEANGKWPTIGNVSVVKMAEGDSYTESTPTISNNTWNAHKIGGYAKMTMETLEDSKFDVVELIAERFAKALAEEIDKKLLIGNNTNAPYGLYYTASLGSYAAAGAISYDVLVEGEYTLGAEYRKNAAWVGTGTQLKRIMQLKDSQNRPLFQRAMEEGSVDRVLGYPYILAPDSSIPNNFLFFGDPSYYWVMWRNGMTVKMSEDATDGTNHAWLQDELWLKVFARLDGILSLTQSFIKITGITG